MKSKKTSKKRSSAKCTCRPPKSRHDCTYCGCGTAMPEGAVCGVCHEAGIDGPVIRGSGRVVCKLHKGLLNEDLEYLIKDKPKRPSKPVTRREPLTTRQFCKKLMQAVALIDDVCSTRNCPSSVSKEQVALLIDISDHLDGLASDIELGDS